MANKMKNSILGLPKQVFEDFFTQLAESDVPEDVIKRLKMTIIDKGDLTLNAIKESLLPED